MMTSTKFGRRDAMPASIAGAMSPALSIRTAGTPIDRASA